MKDLEKLLDSALAMCDEVNIPYREITEIKFNNRLSACWGRCLTVDNKTFVIEIQGKFARDEFSRDENVLAVIIHEIIHTCDGAWNHNALFHEYGKRITDRFGIKVYTKTPAAERVQDVVTWEKSHKYAVKCNCRTIYKDRMCGIIKNSTRYRCKNCHSVFTRIK